MTEKRRQAVQAIHWQYFLALDSDFSRLARYIEPTSDNFNTYSVELARMLMMATQECDVILKMLCNRYGNPDCSNECQYREAVSQKLPALLSVCVSLFQYDIDVVPFESWQLKKTPKWWTANNKDKHERNLRFSHASLKNVIDALAGLFLLNLYLYKSDVEKEGLSPWPHNFHPELESTGGSIVLNPTFQLPLP